MWNSIYSILKKNEVIQDGNYDLTMKALKHCYVPAWTLAHGEV